MYPIVFRIGSFAVSSFGVMVAIGTVAGLWILRRELRRSGLPSDALDVAVAAVLGGLLGAKLLWVGEHGGEGPFVELLASRAGLSWFGGLSGGAATALAMLRRKGLRLLPVLAAAAPALAVGHAIGRIGCLLVGDDYGRPSDLPWALAFPEGLPPTSERVHPTQIYEAIALIPIAWALFRLRRRHSDDRIVVGWYLILTGSVRFAIEFIRVNERVALGLTVAHWVSAVLVVTGLVLLTSAGRAAPAEDRLRL